MSNKKGIVQDNEVQRPRSRRDFLKEFGAAAAGLLAAGCRRQDGTEVAVASTAVPTATQGPATATATAAPTEIAVPVVTATQTPSPTAVPSPTWTAEPTAGPTSTPVPISTSQETAPVGDPVTQVAIGYANDYTPRQIYEQVRDLLDGIGGIGDVVSRGDRVAVKTNLTGGLYFEPPDGLLATESYLTHPEVVRALCQLLRDAGAREIYIVEAVFDDESYRVFGYEQVAEDIGARLIDLNRPDPYDDLGSVAVGDGWQIYSQFTFHHILQEVDAFVSVGKVKCHYNAGVTHTMKNLVGLVPASNYALEPSHWWRSALHGHSEEETQSRLPRVILDLNRARPIDLALLDGVMTGEGGEAPRGSFHPVQPGVLLAGKDAVATDAVATAVMGFDPTVEPPNAPFLRGDNYLNMATKSGMGTNRLEEIDVVGLSVEDVIYPFKPSTQL